MPSPAVLVRILGALFYYSPTRPEVRALFDCLPTLDEIYPWRDPRQVAELCSDWSIPDEEQHLWQFSVLFEGQGEMPAPPWGSVYLEKDNLLMGDSTAEYRKFLLDQGMTFDSCINEPEDQFGLMLLACSALLAEGKECAANQLLETHLLLWGYRYLELLQQNPVSSFYAKLAQVTTLFLQDYQQKQALNPPTKQLFL